MASYLVSGGAGFIGSNLVRALVAQGEEVTLLDVFSTGRRTNLEGIEGQIRVVEGSVLDPCAIEEAFQGVSHVLHLAAIASVQRSVEAPLRCHQVNTEGTLRVLLAAREHGVRRVVLASSSAVYGDAPGLPKRESMQPDPLSPYALTKQVGEVYGRIFSSIMGLGVVSLRYFNVFGPHQSPDNHYAAVIPRFITRMLQGLPPIIYGDGMQTRDYCHVDNVVRASLLACLAPGAAGQLFNIASGERTDLLSLVRLLNSILGTQLQPLHEPPRAGEIRHSEADLSMARRVLGYESYVSFTDGLERTVRWYRDRVAQEDAVRLP